jgi:AMP-polyphosphate phosphotransferase
MLEQVDLNLSVSKSEYQKRLPDLQARLYDLEHAVFTTGIPVMIVFEGWAATGKGGAINVMSERLDARGFRVVPITPPRTAEMNYPWLWRFWQKIPARGQIVVYDTSWYRRVLIDRINKTVKRREWENAYQDIAEFEEMLSADGTVILKFWLHISKKEQSRRFKRLLKDELTAWQVTEEDRSQHKKYGKYLVAVEEMLARTDSPHAPWVIVEATEKYHTRIKIIETIIRTLEARLADVPAKPEANPKPKQKPKKRAATRSKKEAAHA